MNIKITVDNNFFDNFDSYPDAKAKERIIAEFKKKHFSFYPTTELITELFGLYHTKRKHLLSKYAAICLDIIDYRVFNGWNLILLSELGIEKENKIFLNTTDVNNLKSILKSLSTSGEYKDMEELLNIAEAEKEKNYNKYKENQEYHFKLLTERAVKTPKMNFEEFYNMDFANEIRKDTVKMLFERNGQSISGDKISKILDNPASYPYYYISSRVFMALFYRHIVSKRKVDTGDHYDQRYLIYLTNLDYLVSNDAGVKELSGDVFGSSKKVINFEELVNLLPE